MRTVVNISLPVSLTAEVDRGVKRFHFASKSEFFRHLLREWLAGRLLADLEQSEREHAEGKAKKLTRVKDLWK
jgi:Arc/MetJ-type ribon-helix-helix transcriptional regulator